MNVEADINNRNIDAVFIISISGSDRREVVKNEILKSGFLFMFWDAIEKDNGADGLRETFKLLFNYCLQNNLQNALIFEDDVRLYTDAIEIINLFCTLPNDYHILKLGANLLCPVEKVNDRLNKIKMSYALHAAIYSKEAMRLILKYIDKPEPIDLIIAKYIEPLGNCYVSNKMLATQRPTKSNIFVYDETKHSNFEFYEKETGIVRWDKLMEQQWANNTKHLK